MLYLPCGYHVRFLFFFSEPTFIIPKYHVIVNRYALKFHQIQQRYDNYLGKGWTSLKTRMRYTAEIVLLCSPCYHTIFIFDVET